MKKLLSYVMLVMFITTACTVIDTGDQNSPDAGNENPSLELGTGIEQDIIIDPQGGSEIIRFTSAQSWYVEAPEDASWLQLSPVEGDPGSGRVKVKAEANTSGGKRSAEFNVCSGTLSITFSVTQDSYEFRFEVPETEMHISADGGIIPIPINTNQEFYVKCAQDWLIPSPDMDRVPNYVIVAAEPNLTQKERTSEIVVSCDLMDVTVTVTQDAADQLLSQWTDKSFMSRSLAVRFTADWCGYCPYMATAFESAKEQLNGAFEIVSLHGSESTYEFSGTNQLARRFNIDGYPTGIIDFRASIPNYSSIATTASAAVNVAQETKRSYPTTSGIAVDSYLSGTELTVFVPIYFHQPDSYRVTVLLLEDGIDGRQNQGGIMGKYTHDDVARKALTSMSGDPVKIISANTVKTLTYTTKVRSEWNSDNLKVLVYVERPYGDLPLATGVSGAKYINYDETFIDNCRAVKLGETAVLELE